MDTIANQARWNLFKKIVRMTADMKKRNRAMGSLIFVLKASNQKCMYQ